jgi:DNA-binding response OmpR family regulator
MTERFLIVDDSELTRDLLITYLSDFEYEVDSAEDVSSAITLLESHEYDIVITDKNMPGIDLEDHEGGMTLLEYIQKNLPCTETIMMTGYATVETSIRAMKMGAFDYLTKPFTRDEFINTVNRLLEYKRYLNPENTITIYKDFHNELLDFLDKVDSYTEDERHKLLKSIDTKIDLFFKNQKNWENIIIQQRELLSNIAQYSGELKEFLSGKGISHHLIENIIEEANKKI